MDEWLIMILPNIAAFFFIASLQSSVYGMESIIYHINIAVAGREK
jgi:hypothetical protein